MELWQFSLEVGLSLLFGALLAAGVEVAMTQKGKTKPASFGMCCITCLIVLGFIRAIELVIYAISNLSITWGGPSC